MTIWNISIRNIKSKPLYTMLSIFVLTLSIALLLGIQQLKSSFDYQMKHNLGTVDMVIGAKGSPLQLVLSSVLHLDNPTGNIEFDEAKKISQHPMVKLAVPISYGDNYKGYRIVGTTKDFMLFYEAEIQTGRMPKRTLEVVLGQIVADKLGLTIGDKIKSSHGLIENAIEEHEEELIVVGILKPTQKVIDRLIITNLQSIWDVHDHDHDAHDHDAHDHDAHDHDAHDHDGAHDHDAHDHDGAHDHDAHDHDAHDHDAHDHDAHDHDAHDHDAHDHDAHDHDAHGHEAHQPIDTAGKQITSMLIAFRNPMAMLSMPRRINEETNMQAALPKFELDKLYRVTGIGFKTITWIAYIILLISGLTIFISLFKMIKERSFDLALLRTYGASRWQLIKMVAYEGVILVGVALLIGFVVSTIGLELLTNVLDTDQQNILRGLTLTQLLPILGVVFLMMVISIVLAINPILKMNISTILSNEK